MKKVIGYHECPDCGSGFASTHYRTCRHTGIDPRDIRSPLNGTRAQGGK